MLILADCLPLPPVFVEFALTVLPHGTFKNFRCRHPSLWERRTSRRSVAASDCLHLRGAASPLQAGEGMVSERCPVRARPSPCLILARARLPFRFAAMAASACIAYCQSSRQTAPAMRAASSDAALSSAESAHAYASAFTDLHSPLPLGGPIVDERMWRRLRTPLRDPPGTARQSCCIVPPRTESRKVRTTVPARLGPDRLRQAAPHRKMAFVETALCRGSCVAHG